MRKNSEQRYRATKRVSIINATTNSLLSLLKVTIGYFSHSHALIADGLHSFSDLISDAMVFAAAKAGGHIPDKEHPYGHQRIETIASMIIAIVMSIVGFSIAYNTMHHVISGQAPKVHTWPVLIAAVIAILCYEGLYRYTLAMGQRIHSNLLISNAYHNRSDAYTSLIVVFSVLGTQLGAYWKIPNLDPIAATLIALLIIKMGLKILWQALHELIDAGADPTTLQKIKETIVEVPGVKSIHQLRTRLHSGNIFIDVHLIVDPFISVSEGHHIGEQVHSVLNDTFPQVIDVTVHIDPEDDEIVRPSIHLPNRKDLLKTLQLCWHHLPGYAQINKINLHYLNGELYLEILMPQSVIAQDKQAALLADYYQAVKHLNYIANVTLAFIPAPSHS